MSSHIDTTLLQSLGGYLDTFFTSLQGDAQSLTSFLETLSTINSMVRAHRDRLHEETLVAVHGFASVIDNVVSSMLELEKAGDAIGNEVLTDVSNILNSRMGDLSIVDNATESNKSSLPRPVLSRLAHEWLSSNLHNPYPPKEVKKTIAQRTGSSVREIDNWFMETRKRIGWNKLRKERFSNKQDNIIAAATRFFNPSLNHLSSTLTELDTLQNPIEDLDFEFAMMRQKANDLYSKACPDHASPGQSIGKTERLSRRSTLANDLSYNPCPASYYPSPEPHSPFSRASSPSSIPPIQEDPKKKNLKRRASTPLSLDSETDDQASSPKRKRRFCISNIDPTPGLPSPAATIDLTEDSADDDGANVFDLCNVDQIPRPKRKRRLSQEYTCLPVTKRVHMDRTPSGADKVIDFPPSSSSLSGDVPSELSTSIMEGVRISKRKRRLSEGDQQPPSKRPHNTLCIPRLQTVSDPILPITLGQFSGFDGLPEGFSDTRNEFNDLTSCLEMPPTLGVVLDCYQYDFSTYTPEVYSPEIPTEAPGIFEALHDLTDSVICIPNPENGAFVGLEDCAPFPLSVSPQTNFVPSLLSQTQHLPPASLLDISEGYFPGQFLLGLDSPEAKFTRAQALREELRRLEDELMS